MGGRELGKRSLIEGGVHRRQRGTTGRNGGFSLSSTLILSKWPGPPTYMSDTTVFELWMGRLSAHQSLAIPVV